MQVADHIWHKWLKRPYKLHKGIDQGSGPVVVLLHGIGSSSVTWKKITPLLEEHCRVVSFDLLGFGKSPKPDWLDYSTEDHAKAVITSIRALKLTEPIVLVGHSMGCLVAAHVAKLEPKLVKQLILYEMPLYVGLPNTRRYNRARHIYFLIYNHIMESPELALTTKQSVRSLITRFSGFEISEATWQPFVKSLQNTIISQTTLQDIKQLTVPIDIIYGTLDMLVIRGAPTRIFGKEAAHVTTHTITEIHNVSKRASRFLAERILFVINSAPVSTPALGRTSRLRTASKKKTTTRQKAARSASRDV